MDPVDRLLHLDTDLPAPFQRRRDGSLRMSRVIAERKVFLSRRKLTYKCRVRVDDTQRTIRFWEALVETGSGLASDGDGISPGLGFRKESYRTGPKTRDGSMQQQSRLFGKDYDFQWDYAVVRRVVTAVAAEAGYTLDLVLIPKAV